DALPPYAREATDSACKAALVLGWRADVLRRRPAARRRRISHSAQALPFASCTPEACDAPSSSAPRPVQGGPCTWSRADVLSRRPAARSPPAALHHFPCTTWTAAAARCAFELQLLALRRAVRSTDRADHTASSHPQPSARNRPGERMSLLDEGTYGRPDAEVLPLITPAAARATDRLGHTPLHYAAQNSSSLAVVQALLAANPEAATAIDEGGNTLLHCAAHNSSSVAVVQALLAAYPEAASATTHIGGQTPLHCAAQCSSSVAVVRALLSAYPEAATATDNVTVPVHLISAPYEVRAGYDKAREIKEDNHNPPHSYCYNPNTDSPQDAGGGWLQSWIKVCKRTKQTNGTVYVVFNRRKNGNYGDGKYKGWFDGQAQGGELELAETLNCTISLVGYNP
ncbi:hypothetical protein Ctob_006826, partial [Chrysochromulina tobinii]